MNTLKKMTDQELLAWAREFAATPFDSTIKGDTVVVDAGDYPPNAITMFFAYGHQRKYNDATGGSDTTLDDKLEARSAMMVRFRAGDIGRQAATAADPLTAEIRIKLRAKLKAEGHKLIAELKGMDAKDAAERLDVAWKRLAAAKPEVAAEIEALAKESLKAKAALRAKEAKVSIDTTEL